MYIRPFLIYKYEKVKNRIEFEFEDVLKEYQMIEDELNLNSDEDEDLKGLPAEAREVSRNIMKSEYSHGGLLSQYIQQKMTNQAMSEYYEKSMRGSEFNRGQSFTQNTQPQSLAQQFRKLSNNFDQRDMKGLKGAQNNN